MSSTRGQAEPSAEPAQSSRGRPPRSASSGSTAANNKVQRSSSTANGSTGLAVPPRSLGVSASASNQSSRDASPAPQPGTARTQQRQPAMSGARRSRRNSQQDISPNRKPGPAAVGSTMPSAAAIQRALSAASSPQLPPTSVPEQPSKVPRPTPQKSTANTAGETTPKWPISPRLKSPPPSRRNSSREPPAPSIQVSRSTPTSTPPTTAKNDVVNSDSEQEGNLNMRAGRGVGGAPRTLETVQEASLPATPGPGFESLSSLQSLDSAFTGKTSDDDRTISTLLNSNEELPDMSSKSRESGSESGGNKSDERRRRSVQRMTPLRPVAPPGKGSYAAIASGKSRPGQESASKNMTVETETVTSIPAGVISGPGERITSGRGEGGSIRLKPSNETIRPKKERKKAVRKAPSITSGTASTKADVFEQKVASAVEEATSDDSDETFVYETDPADTQPRPNRHHSRTPSTTSVASLVDHRGNVRPIANIRDSHRVAGKRSMKFANNPYSNIDDDRNSIDRGEGTVRGGTSRASGSGSVHHHHIGRHGRGGMSHIGLFDHDSAFSNGRKTSRQSSRPTSPTYRNPNIHGNGFKKNGEISTYDLENDFADTENHTERSPLIGPRTPRARTPRRPNSTSLRQIEYLQQRRRRGWLRRFAGCIVITIMVLLLVFGALGFLFAMTKPLYNVKVTELQNVLASEQELMLDLLVEAINPNVITVTVGDMNVSVFAKSKHVGTDKWWREHHGETFPTVETSVARRRRRRSGEPVDHLTSHDPQEPYHVTDGVDEGTDPIEEDPEGDSQTMLIGRLYSFDSALSFDGSPFQRHRHFSTGQVRLTKPGNATEDGGTERWERVIQYPFELILRGVLKYELPLSSRKLTASISASTIVKPDNSGGDDSDDKKDPVKVDKGIKWHWDDEDISGPDISSKSLFTRLSSLITNHQQL